MTRLGSSTTGRDARGLYSGPTVVDDQKVAEVLKKLRSLDQAPGPLTGVTQAVDDANPTEAVRIDPGNLKIDTGLRNASPRAAPGARRAGHRPPSGIKSDPGPAPETSCTRWRGPRRSAAA